MKRNQTLNDGPVQMPRYAPAVTVISAGDRFCEGSHGFCREWGVSQKLSGAMAISMAFGKLPPRLVAEAHSHQFETAILILTGKTRVFFGDDLRQFIDVQAGDFLFIPPGLVHGPVNFTDIPMEYVVARATAVED